ncbi:MAG: HlyC/CorC family transporter [Chloroflexi bacterium]|nr:MAG: HlyC/CorC family transporter [Chloroflexota bacterium]
MDTNSTIALTLLLTSAVLLAIVAAAEAAVGAISRTRIQPSQPGPSGMSVLVDSYIRHRQRILPALGVAATFTTVVATISLVALLTGTDWLHDRRTIAAAAGAVFLLTFLRQSARALALTNPQATGARLSGLIRTLQLVFGPIGWVASAPARAAARLFGGDPDATEPDPSGELLALLDQAGGDGTSLSEERRMMRGILAMSDQTVREVMSPRTDIAAVATGGSLEDVLIVITGSGFSRIPLYEDSLDHVVGVIYAKDLLAYLRPGAAEAVRPALREIARPAYFVPETKRVDDLLSELRRDQVHMAIVVDEYGGTAGVVTVEDLIEQIVGEISDEYDVEAVDVQQLSEDVAILDARLPIDDLNELFGMQFDSEDFDTVGGLILSLLGRLAVPGDEVVSEDGRLTLRVLSILGRRIKKVRVTRAATEVSTDTA